MTQQGGVQAAAQAAKRVARRLRGAIRSRWLETAEARWQRTAPQPVRLRGGGATPRRVGVIGVGAQGLAQCRGMQTVNDIAIAGLADTNAERLRAVGESLGLPATAWFSGADELLAGAMPLDLVSIATTAPSHVALGRVALHAGVRRIVLEKPIATRLAEAKAFGEECRSAGAAVVVNYSRRWMLDYRAIRRCIAEGMLGEPRSIFAVVGKGELAMHASHYFDLCRYLLNSEPAWVVSYLDPIVEPNPRGISFADPGGYCVFGFQNGSRACIDFSGDLLVKDPFVVVKGTLGRVMVDEQRAFWTLQSQSQRVWTIPFVEPLKAAVLFARVAAETLSDESAAAGVADGVAALEMILGAHLSQRREQARVNFPLAETDAAAVGVEFP